MKEPYMEFCVEHQNYVIYANSGTVFRKQLFSHYDENIVKVRLKEIIRDKEIHERYEEWYESCCHK